MSTPPPESPILGRSLTDLPTPSLLVDHEVLLRNVERTQRLADQAGKRLRPHVKSHKMTEVAQIQVEHGARGLTCSKVTEAEWLVEQGFDDILIAYPIADVGRAERVKKLSGRARISVIVDNAESGRLLGHYFLDGPPLEVLIKVDTGLQRVGVPPEGVLPLVRQLSRVPGISVLGVCMHEGLTYGLPDRAERAERTRLEAELLRIAAERVAAVCALDTVVISAGSTPGFEFTLDEGYLTELRPGNYVFNDAVQVGLGVANPGDCSLTVLSTVVGGVYADRFVVDAGSKALGLDRGAHGVVFTDGYGLFTHTRGLRIAGLSEEHGRGIRMPGEAGLGLGQTLRFVPNHACSVVNNFPHAYVIADETIIDIYQINARGALS